MVVREFVRSPWAWLGGLSVIVGKLIAAGPFVVLGAFWETLWMQSGTLFGALSVLSLLLSEFNPGIPYLQTIVQVLIGFVGLVFLAFLADKFLDALEARLDL